MITSEYDVVIVGAGPAGCTIANFLSKNYKVLLLDWSKFPRDKPCGGLLVDEAIHFFEEKGMELPEYVFSNPKNLDVKFVDWNSGLSFTEKRNFLNVSRKSFDSYLLQIARKNGNVDFFPETKFLNLELEKGYVKIFIETHNVKQVIKSKYLIGADGAFSSVRKQISKTPIKYYIAAQEWVKTNPNSNKNKIILFIFDNELTDYYSWVIPKGEHLIVGLAIMHGNNTKKKFDLFKEKLKENLGIGGNYMKLEAAVGLRPQQMDDIVLGNGPVLLVGEAAGLVSPSTGEGISFALRSGFNCAKALNTNFGAALDEYVKLCHPLLKEIGVKIKKAEVFSNLRKRLRLFEIIKNKQSASKDG